jgi:pyruvate dehydrogenase E1 component
MASAAAPCTYAPRERPPVSEDCAMTTEFPSSPALPSILQSLRDHVAKGALSMIDWANHKPANRGQKPKIGGHQASSMSSVDLLCALYLHALKPGDRLAVKPHAAPVLYALMHLLGQLPRSAMYELREFKGPQPYPTELKNPGFVDYTTSSEALGVACTIYDAYGAKHHDRALAKPLSRAPVAATYWAHCGDGELTEGQIDESLYDAGRWRLDNLVWIVDLNRQSLDRVMDDSGHLHDWARRKFEGQGWQVLEARWGSRAEALFDRPGGDALKRYLEGLDDALFQPLLIAREAQLHAVLRGDTQSPSIADRGTQYLLDLYRERVLIDAETRAGLQRLVADLPEPAPDVREGPLSQGIRHLGGHDLALLCDRFAEARRADRPVCLIAHTVKGYETSAAAHPENHGGLLPSDEVAAWGLDRGLPPDDLFPVPTDAPSTALLKSRAEALFPDALHAYAAPPIDVRTALADVPFRGRSVVSSGEAFQSVNLALLKSDLAPYLQFGAPDVGQTTHLGVVIKQTGVFAPRDLPDALAFMRESNGLAFDWRPEATGQFHAFGIAEGNAMLWAYAFGRRKKLIEGKVPLLPVVTVYDKFFERGFNQLDYAVYSNARFIAVGTPSGTGLSRETATHQSLQTLRMMMDLPGILAYEPAFAADLHAIYLHALTRLWDPDGEAFYLRLTTQPLEQPATLPPDHAERAVRGAYWLIGDDERDGLDQVRFVASGRKLKEVREAAALLHAEGIGSRILNVTSYEALWRDWDAFANSPDAWDAPEKSYYLHDLFAEDDLNLPLIIVGDHVPSVAEWLPSALQRIRGHRFLGPRRNGEAGALTDIDRLHGMATSDIVHAARQEVAWRRRHGLGAPAR